MKQNKKAVSFTLHQAVLDHIDEVWEGEAKFTSKSQTAGYLLELGYAFYNKTELKRVKKNGVKNGKVQRIRR